MSDQIAITIQCNKITWEKIIQLLANDGLGDLQVHGGQHQQVISQIESVLKDLHKIKPPINARRENAYRGHYHQKSKRDPTLKEIADDMGFPDMDTFMSNFYDDD